jgi:hypothetical protein
MKIAGIDPMKPQKLLLSQSHPFAIQHGENSKRVIGHFPFIISHFPFESMSLLAQFSMTWQKFCAALYSPQ